MFLLKRISNWSKSSVTDDKQEQLAYQKFQDQFTNIKNKSEEYLQESGYTDSRLYVEYKGKMVPISYISALIESLKTNRFMSVNERALEVANTTNLYNQKLKEIEYRIIDLAVQNPNNIYLAYISKSIEILNSLLKQYAYLLAVQRSGVNHIDNNGALKASQKIKALKDEIEIRLVQIESRLTLEDNRRR